MQEQNSSELGSAVEGNVYGQIISNVLNAPQTYQNNKARDKSLRANAKQLENKATAVRGAGTRAAEEKLRKGKVIQSAVRAAQAGAGGAKDAGTVETEAALQQVTDANAMNAIFETEEQAKGLDHAAKLKRWEAKQIKSPLEQLGSLYFTGGMI